MNKNQIEPLNMEDALRLHGVIAPFLVEPEEDEPTINYVQGIIQRMIEDDPGAYVRCIEIMSGLPENEILKMESLDVLGLFVEGLKVNQIVNLYRFGKGLKYA